MRVPSFSLLFMLVATAVAAQEAEFPTPIEFTPYRVKIAIDLPAGNISTFAPEFRAAILRLAGERWRIEQTAKVDHAWAQPSAWHAFSASAAKETIDSTGADFVYLIRVSNQTGTTTSEVRVWEPLVNVLSPLRTVTALDERTLPELTARAVWGLFRPRGHWEKIDDTQVRLRVQAAALGVDSGLPPLTEPGEVFSPWIVLRKRDQSIDRVVPQPWTFLVADELTEGRGQARIVSGIRNPLGLKPRGRVEFLAVAARSQWPQTQFTFRRASSPPQVLAAHEVQWHRDQFPIDADHPPDIHHQLTDRFGRVKLARDPESRLLWLSITSGSQLLARLPVVPGEEGQRDVLLPDDSLRLQVEGQLQLVQSDLVSFVATRTALIAITRAAAKKNEWDTVDARLKQLDALPSTQSFLDRVTAIRVTAVAKAKAQKDRTSEQRIVRMADDTDELVKRYLSDDKLAVLKEEVAELRKAASDDPQPMQPKS